MDSDSEIRKLCDEVEEYCSNATPGPLVVEKHDSYPQGCWHYAIKTDYNHPDHPHSPRFVAWMCGSLGESIHSRRHPDDYRSDPQIEADAELFARARTDLPKLAAALRERLEAERWIPVSERLPERGRVEIFSPIYADGHEMRFRLVDAQFVRICKEATHWRLPSAPEVKA